MVLVVVDRRFLVTSRLLLLVVMLRMLRMTMVPVWLLLHLLLLRYSTGDGGL